MNTTTQTLALIAEAIEAGTPIQFDYVDIDGNATRDRVVEPENVFISKVDGVKLKGQCRLRQSVRSFKVSAMTNVRKYAAPVVTVMLGDFVKGGNRNELYLVASHDDKAFLSQPSTGHFKNSGVVHSGHGPIELKKLLGNYNNDVSQWKIVKARIVEEVDPVLKPVYFECSNGTGHIKVDVDGTVYYGGQRYGRKWVYQPQHRGVQSMRDSMGDFDRHHKQVSHDPIA